LDHTADQFIQPSNLDELAARLEMFIEERDPIIYDGELVAAYGETSDASIAHWLRSANEHGLTILGSSGNKAEDLATECLQPPSSERPAVWRSSAEVARIRIAGS
jgi:hypothetical protein